MAAGTERRTLETSKLVSAEKRELIAFSRIPVPSRDQYFLEDVQLRINRMILLERQEPRINYGQDALLHTISSLMITEDPASVPDLVRQTVPSRLT